MNRAMIVVPCYNEAERIDVAAFTSFLRAREDFGFVMVDDGSTDSTLTKLRPLEVNWGERCRLIALETNRGKAEAVRAGMMSCRGSAAQYVGYFDADLATPLSALPELLEILIQNERLALVMGARVQLLGRRIRRKASRHYLGRVFATAVSLTLDLPVYDTQCGAKLFRVSPVLWEVLSQPFISRWIFDVEILARLSRLRWLGEYADLREVVYEHDLAEWSDKEGSKLKLHDFVRAVLELLQIRRQVLRQ